MNPLALLSPIGSVLARVPAWAWVLIAVLAWGGWQRHTATATRAEFERAKAQAAADRQQAEQEAARLAAIKAKRLQENLDEATLEANRNKAAAAASARESVKLRDMVATLQAYAHAASGAAYGGCQAAASAVDLLANVFRSAESRAVALAEYADAAAAAGRECQREFGTANLK